MNAKEAERLLSLIETDKKPGVARLHRLGNGEHVCIMKRLDFWCWSFADYNKYRELEEQRHARKAEGIA